MMMRHLLLHLLVLLPSARVRPQSETSVSPDNLSSLQPNKAAGSGNITMVTQNESPSSLTTPAGATVGALWGFCKTLDFTIDVVFIGLIVLLGYVGNVLSMISFWSSRNQNSSRLLLLCLAIFDMGTLTVIGLFLLVIPNLCQHLSLCSHYLHFTMPYFLAYVLPLGSMFHTISTWTVLLVAFQRYLAVCQPSRVATWGSVKVVRIQIAILIFGSAAFHAVRFTDNYTFPYPNNKGIGLAKSQLVTNPIYNAVYVLALYYIFIFIIPFAILLFLTYKLIRGLRAAKARREEMTHVIRDENDLTLTLVAVVVIFLICQIPNPIRRAIGHVTPRRMRVCGSVYVNLTYFSNLMFCVNAAFNFVLYCLFSRRFRKSIFKKFCANKIGVWMSSTQNKTNAGNTLNTEQ